jgi:hypothetical protein
MSPSKPFVLAFVVIFALLALVSTEMTITYDSPEQYAGRTTRITFDSTDFATENTIFDFGHSSQCAYLLDTVYPAIDTIGHCYVTNDITQTVGELRSKCEKFDTTKDEQVAFTLTLTAKVPEKSTVTCWINYADEPMIGRVEGDKILYRSYKTDATTKPDPVPTESVFPIFTQYTASASLLSFAPTTGEITIQYNNPGSGIFKVTYDSTKMKLSFDDLYCYTPNQGAQTITGRWFYIDKTQELYLHKRFGPLSKEPLTCTLTISANVHIPQALFTFQRGSPYEAKFAFEYVKGIDMAIPNVVVPTEPGVDPTQGTLSFPVYFPAGVSKGALVGLSFFENDKANRGPASTEEYIKGYHHTTLPTDFEYVNNGLYLAVRYTSETPLPAAAYFIATWTFDHTSFTSQADRAYVIIYKNIKEEDVGKESMLIVKAIYPEYNSKSDNLKKILYIRSVLRNKMIQNELTNSGWSLNITSVVTAHLVPMDYTDGNGWVTVFYLTDSYNSVRRKYTCHSTQDPSKPLEEWHRPEMYIDFGTIYVFSKTILAPGESITINCLMPIQYQNLIGYLPPAKERQLRIASWSYDRTTPDGANTYESNHSHAITPLVPIDANHYSAVVFKFQTEESVLATEDSFINHFVKIFKVMSEVKDNETQKSIFGGNLHSEGVYSILNYQFLNGTGVTFDPYNSIDVKSLNAHAATCALAIEQYGPYTVEYFEQYLAELNRVLAPYNTIVTQLIPDRVYLESNGIAACGSPTQRKCLVGGKQYNSSSCGGYGEASTRGCTLTPDVYNPFSSNSVAISSLFAIIVAVVMVIF